MKTYRTDFVRGVVDGGRMGLDIIGVLYSKLTQDYNSTVGGRGCHNRENSLVYRYSKKTSVLAGLTLNVIFIGTPQGTLFFYNLLNTLVRN